MTKRLATVAILLGCAVPALAQDMTGSSVDLVSPTAVVAGDAGIVFRFYVYNASPDSEWTERVNFTFPACFTVTAGAYDDGGLGWVFVFAAAGNSASFIDGDGGYGEIYDGDGGYFEVTVTVGAACPAGPASIHWLQQGDSWGSTPHLAEGDLEFTISGTATNETTWSRIRALY